MMDSSLFVIDERNLMFNAGGYIEGDDPTVVVGS
jgi:hypothetical protein